MARLQLQTGLPMALQEPPPLGESALPAGSYRGETVIVTGGGTGLGRAIALEFARLGASVAVLSRKEEHRAAGVAAVQQLGARAFAAECDVRRPEQVARAFAAVGKELGPPAHLVNNAAGNFPAPAEDLSPNGWRAVVDIVLNGGFNCAREFARGCMAAGRGGTILNIGASYAWTGGPGFAHSAAAKAGLKNMTESLAVEWAPYGIRVNGLAPGLFPHKDESADIRAVPGRGQRAEEEASCPAQRTGRPHELGWAATYLCSRYAAYITGHTLTVDGANWQRRAMRQPRFTPIREQLGRGPFNPDA